MPNQGFGTHQFNQLAAKLKMGSRCSCSSEPSFEAVSLGAVPLFGGHLKPSLISLRFEFGREQLRRSGLFSAI